MLNAHLHLVPRLRMSGAIIALSLYAFMERTRKTLYLLCMKDIIINEYVSVK
jgi:hypothetical protein